MQDISRSVVLHIITEPDHILISKLLSFTESKILRGDNVLSMYRVEAGNINPGDTKVFTGLISSQVKNLSNFLVKGVDKSGIEKPVDPETYRIVYPLEIRLTAEDTDPRTEFVYLTTGRESWFKKEKKPYYLYRNGEMTIYSKESYSNP